MTTQNSLRRTLISTTIAFLLAFVAYNLSQSYKRLSSKDQKVNRYNIQNEDATSQTKLKNAFSISDRLIVK